MIDLNAAASTQKPGKPLMKVGARILTYGDQWSRLHALHQWFHEQGLASDAPVLLAVSDEFEQASLLLALILLGKPPLILDPGSTPVEAATIMGNSDISAIIADAVLRERWGLAELTLPQLPVAAAVAAGKGVLGGLLRKRAPVADEASWPGLVAHHPAPFPLDVPPESLAYVIFTSGTTSVPKGVEISRDALAQQMSVLNAEFALDSGCRILNTLPLYHADGVVQGPLLAWTSGGTLFRPMAFSTQALQPYMDGVYRDRITHFIAVPTMLSLIVRFGQEWTDSFEDDNFRMIVSCAGHLERHLWERVESTFGVTVVNLYGLSETVTSALISGPEGESRRVGTIGKPVNSRIRIVDDSGNAVSSGEPGELLVAGPQLMRGYHNNPQATAESIRDGWLYTGDLAKELESGHVQIVGRKKNQIISGGRNTSPEEVADCLNRHSAVIESIVFGQQDPDWGEQVVAMVVCATAGIDETELTEWCRGRLSEYKIPKRILIVDELDKGPSGKIRIEVARRLYEDRMQQRSRQTEDAADIQTRVLQLAADTFRLHRSELNRDSTIENTPGWDSMGHLSLLLAAETEFDVRFSAREIMQIDSIRKLVELCSGKAQS